MDLDKLSPLQQTAATTAAKLVVDTAKADDERSTSIAKNVIQDFFNEAQEQKRFLDTARIPFICDDIKRIREDISNLSRLIWIGVGIIATASVGISLLTRIYVK